jgi:DNA mismatch repair ATPase MutS
VLLAASIAAALLVSPWGWVGAGVAMYFLVMVHMRYQDRVGLWTRSVRALQMLLRACSLLDGSGLALASSFTGRGARAGRLNRSLAASGVPGAREYANWFAAADVRYYYRTLDRVFGARDFLRECYRLCAALEADVTLARHLRECPTWCWATRTGARTLAIDGGVHPLLDEARGLSVTLDGKGAFLSGQNGVGKSTFLRMLGLNLVVARAFGFCYAQSASLPALPVVASMQNEDSLLGGQSLYIAELARARALLARARGPRPVVCLVDEIFRGTNHEESVSAATAVVDALARHALVVVSSHNLVLGSLLAEALAPWRIVRHGGGLQLEPGVLGRTNGVALLAEHGFDAAVQRRAEQVAAWLAQTRLSGSPS